LTETDRRAFFIGLGEALRPHPNAKAAAGDLMASWIAYPDDARSPVAALDQVLESWPKAKAAVGAFLQTWQTSFSGTPDP
jgi:hypothetical protein